MCVVSAFFLNIKTKAWTSIRLRRAPPTSCLHMSALMPCVWIPPALKGRPCLCPPFLNPPAHSTPSAPRACSAQGHAFGITRASTAQSRSPAPAPQIPCSPADPPVLYPVPVTHGSSACQVHLQSWLCSYFQPYISTFLVIHPLSCIDIFMLLFYCTVLLINTLFL